MREYLEQRYAELDQQEKQLWADLNATIGAKQEIALLFKKLDEQNEQTEAGAE